MRFSPALSLAAAAILIVTLGIKLASLGAKPAVDGRRFLADLGTALSREGFAVSVQGSRMRRIVAERGDCRIKARYYPPHGTLQDAIEDLGRGIGPTRYVYRGEWRSTPPKIRPLMEFYLQRELARAGIAIPMPAIAAVSASPACGQLPAAPFGQNVRMRR